MATNEEPLRERKNVHEKNEYLVKAYIRESCQLMKAMEIEPRFSTDLVKLISSFCRIFLQFIYDHDGDENGLIYAMGTEFGNSVIGWVNPVTSGLIKLSTSKWSIGDINDSIGRKSVATRCYNISNCWLCFDFSEHFRIQPTHYSIRHWNQSKWFLRNWTFDGSKDNGKKWTTLIEHVGDCSLMAAGQMHTWQIKDCNGYYGMFRIRMTSASADTPAKDNSSTGGSHVICCSGFEIYGLVECTK